MNPFQEEIFNNYQQFDVRYKEIQLEQEKLLADRDITVDNVVDYLISFKDNYTNASNVAAPLYYFRHINKIKSVLHYVPDPTADYKLGTFSDEFYNKFYDKLGNAKKYLFSWLPSHLQTEDRVKEYFKGNRDASFGNFQGIPSENLLLILFDINFPATIKTMKQEWWTPRLKKLAIIKDKLSMLYMSSTVVTKQEIIKLIRKDSRIKDMNNSLFSKSWGKLDPLYRVDQEIRAEYAIVCSVHVFDLGSDFLSECTEEFYMLFLKKSKPELISKGFWNRVPSHISENKDLQDLLIKKLPFEAITYLNLNKTQLKRIYRNTKKMEGWKRLKVQIVMKLMDADLYSPEMITEYGLTFSDFDTILSDDNLKRFLSPETVDYLFDNNDVTLFKAKARVTKLLGSIDIRKIYKMMPHLTYAKLKSKIQKHLDDNDYLFLILTSRTDTTISKSDKEKIDNYIHQLRMDGILSASKEIQDIINSIPVDTTYENFFILQDLFFI